MRNWFVYVLVVFAGLSHAALSAQKRAPVIDMHMLLTISRSSFPLEPHLHASHARAVVIKLLNRERALNMELKAFQRDACVTYVSRQRGGHAKNDAKPR